MASRAMDGRRIGGFPGLSALAFLRVDSASPPFMMSPHGTEHGDAVLFLRTILGRWLVSRTAWSLPSRRIRFYPETCSLSVGDQLIEKKAALGPRAEAGVGVDVSRLLEPHHPAAPGGGEFVRAL